MPPVQDQSHLARELREIAAELDMVVRQAQVVRGKVQGAIGSSATGADRRMVSSLFQVSESTRGAKEALAAAAGELQRLR